MQADLLGGPAILWDTSLDPDELYNCNKCYEAVAGSKTNEGAVLPVRIVINALPPRWQVVQR